MKKHTSPSPGADQGSEPVAHLDEKLTEITTSAAETLKKWRTPLLAVFAAVVIGIIAYSIYGALAESRASGINETLYALFESSAATEEGYSPPESEVQALLDASRGTAEERIVAKKVATFFMKQADALEPKAEPSASIGPGASEPGAAKPEAPAKSPEVAARQAALWDKALALAEATLKDYPDDWDVQYWASALKTRIEASKVTSWMPAKRSSQPILLPPAGPAPTDAAAPAVIPAAPAAVIPAAPAAVIPAAPAVIPVSPPAAKTE